MTLILYPFISYSFSNIMCKYTEANGDTNLTQFTTDSGTAFSGVNSFIFLLREGHWAEFVGQKYKMIYLKYKKILKVLQIDKRTQSFTVE